MVKRGLSGIASLAAVRPKRLRHKPFRLGRGNGHSCATRPAIVFELTLYDRQFKPMRYDSCGNRRETAGGQRRRSRRAEFWQPKLPAPAFQAKQGRCGLCGLEVQGAEACQHILNSTTLPCTK